MVNEHQAKRPKVLICIWQRKRDSRGAATEDITLFELFESLNIGRIFSLLYVELLLGINV